MLLEFAVENFRSIKDRQVLSMIAEPSKAKGENVFEVPLGNGGSIRLLKTAVIYGANASGKSNVIKALGSLAKMIRSNFPGAGRPIKEYDPFAFADETLNRPTVFDLTFLYNQVKYIYKVSFLHSHIVEEEMISFPKGQSQKVFSRIASDSGLAHKIKLGKSWGNKTIEVFKNQLALQKFGLELVHEPLSSIYVFISDIDFNDVAFSSSNSAQVQRMAQQLSEPHRKQLFKKLEHLIQAADTKISGLSQKAYNQDSKKTDWLGTNVVHDSSVDHLYSSFSAASSGSGSMYTSSAFNQDGEYLGELMRTKTSSAFGLHKYYKEGKEQGVKELDFDEESEGTKALFWRGALILDKLEKGGILIFDELDNSLHPKLVKFLIKLFTHPLANPHNTQVILATHEVTLLDRDLFRTDQIWITEKNDLGETELYSVQDFEGVREDIPFDKWYMAGKFGGQPKLEDIESIFSNE